MTSVLVIFPEMDGVRPRLTSFFEYLDRNEKPLVPHSDQKCRLRDIFVAENGTFCKFYHKYSSFMKYLSNFELVKFSELVTKFVMNEKMAKNWHKLLLRRLYETINIAEKNYFHSDFLAAPLIF